jgi:hypothetical protein
LYDHRYTATYLDCVRRYEPRPEVFGEHDAVYRRAERLRPEIDDSENTLRVVDEDPATEQPVRYDQRRQREGRLFMAWNDRALAEFGFEPQEIPVLRRLDTDGDLTALEPTMRPAAWERAMNLAMYGHPDGPEAAALADPERSRDLPAVAADELADLLARPIEDWMVYLDPGQQQLVDRVFHGPARIRGAAGTGKTVVALHRARRLARVDKRVLVTTYVRNLYQADLAEQGLADFNDILLTAYDVASQHPDRPLFDAVIIDEAQDLTETAVRLLAALIDLDAPDCLLLVGDGQQSIYPGGFHLASAGIDVRGRAHVLTRNYRNTGEIYRLAAEVVDGRPFDDGAETLETSRGQVELACTGPAPVTVAAAAVDEHDLALAAAIEAAVAAGTGPGDLAVLVPTSAQVTHYTEQIAGLGLPTQPLAEYDGVPTPLVKVGTYQRAKGLEFKRVFVPRLDPDGLREARGRGEDDASYGERIDLLRRQLFVAMTRARDALWLGWVGAPSSLLPAGGVTGERG